MWNSKQYKNEFSTTCSTGISSTLASVPFSISVLLVAFLFFLLSMPPTASAQRNDILEVKAVKSEIRTRFSLSERDLVRIEPWIDQEGRKLIKMYVRFNGDEPEYSS